MALCSNFSGTPKTVYMIPTDFCADVSNVLKDIAISEKCQNSR